MLRDDKFVASFFNFLSFSSRYYSTFIEGNAYNITLRFFVLSRDTHRNDFSHK